MFRLQIPVTLCVLVILAATAGYAWADTLDVLSADSAVDQLHADSYMSVLEDTTQSGNMLARLATESQDTLQHSIHLVIAYTSQSSDSQVPPSLHNDDATSDFAIITPDMITRQSIDMSWSYAQPQSPSIDTARTHPRVGLHTGIDAIHQAAAW